MKHLKTKAILPQAVVQELYHATNGDAYVTSDVGQHQMFVAQYYHFNKPRRWINSGGLGTMGFGLPAALGVKLAFPKKRWFASRVRAVFRCASKNFLPACSMDYR